MAEEKRFVVKKDAKTDVITYMEYERLKGFNVKPKKNVSFEDMINVESMILINPSLIEKLIDKKIKKTMEKLIAMLSVVSDDESDDDSMFDLILDEIDRFKKLLLSKYKEYMEEEKLETTLKKLEIIEREVKLRKSILINNYNFEVNNRNKPR